MADTYPIVRLTTGPSTDADILFDFNDLGFPEHDGFSFGAAKFLGAPDAVNPQIGLRQIQFNYVINADQGALDAVMTDLGRALMRSRAWLQIQRRPNAEPRWAHVYASLPDALSWELAEDTSGDAVDDVWIVPIRIDADGLLRGAKVTWDPIAITNDPEDGGCFAVLPEVLGDVSAEVRVEIRSHLNDQVEAESAAGDALISICPTPGGYDALQFWPIGTGDGLTAVNGTAAAASDAGAAGGSARTTAFTTTDYDVRLTGAPGFSDAPMIPGRYRLLHRGGADKTSGGKFRMGIKVGNGTGAKYRTDLGRVNPFDNGGFDYGWTDLGVTSFPTGIPDGGSDIPIIPSFDLSASCNGDDAHGLTNDTIVLVPVELLATEDTGAEYLPGTMRFLSRISVASSTPTDGEILTVLDPLGADWQVDNPGGVPGQAFEGIVPGPRLQVSPGYQNVLHLIRHVRAPGVDYIDTTADVTISYYPCYLNPQGE